MEPDRPNIQSTVKQPTLTLRFYVAEDICYLKEWITDKTILFQYAGPGFEYPITEIQMREYQKKHPERQFYMGIFEDSAVAFGEIIPQDPESVRLGRLLVGDGRHRGKGIGTQFVKALLKEAKTNFMVNEVDLFVLHDNEQAIRCYEKAGFRMLEDKNYIIGPDGRRHLINKMNRSI
jgi:RimJ/RimL family protein N-acetyltransferase